MNSTNLDADEALEVRVPNYVGRDVADEGVEALQEEGQLGAVLARVLQNVLHSRRDELEHGDGVVVPVVGVALHRLGLS